MGKTTLVQRFVDELASRGEEPWFLAGRAYERESVPYYKAIDKLDRSLSKPPLAPVFSDLGTQVTLPKDIWALS